MASGGFLSQVIWYNSTIGLPLDTVSIVLSQYNNSVLTTTTTVYGGDIALLSGMTLPQAVSVQAEINNDFEIQGYLLLQGYDGLAGYFLANATNETAMNTLGYPTPYMAITGITLWTSASGSCDQISTAVPQSSCSICYLNDEGIYGAERDNFDTDFIGSTIISLTTTFYAPLSYLANYPTDMLGRFEYFNEQVQVPLSSFIEFISSETQLLMSLPILASCSYVPAGFGPPALKIPVSALTATVTATTTRSSLYAPGNTPTPASPIEPPIGPPTITQPVPLPPPNTQISPNQGSPDL